MAAGQVLLQGEITIRPVFSNKMMFAITKNIRTSSSYNAQIQCIKWDRYGSTKLFSWDLTAVVNNITSLVSFGTLGAVV